MSNLPYELRRAIWERDGHRCKQCGVAVAGDYGCLPQTHHEKPKSIGGTDDPENLWTLCLRCHARLPSAGHTSILSNLRPEEIASYVKAFMWDFATSFLFFVEYLPCREFLWSQVLEEIKAFQGALKSIGTLICVAIQGDLESVRTLICVAIQKNPHPVEYRFSLPDQSPEAIGGILRGVYIAYWTRQTEEWLDEQVRGKASE